jgi:hypothetical protein
MGDGAIFATSFLSPLSKFFSPFLVSFPHIFPCLFAATFRFFFNIFAFFVPGVPGARDTDCHLGIKFPLEMNSQK